jgi:hypothetical protein
MVLESCRQDHRTAIVREVLRSRGSPLDPSVRALMEARFGRDLGLVRLHTGDLAAASATALGARAYTVGSHVVFGEGRYRLGTRDGLWLLAHELAHVVQQGGGAAAPALGITSAGDPLEEAANQAADLISAGRSLPSDFAFGAAPAGAVQCHEMTDPVNRRCGGWTAPALNANAVFQAHWVIEENYRVWRRVWGPATMNLVFYGSNWDTNFAVPTFKDDRLQTQFATELLTTVRGWPAEERPNIIDFPERAAYFFWRYPAPDRVLRIINRFHAILPNLERRYSQWQWVSETAGWFPDHVLPFLSDPRERFVCTSMTDHRPPRGLILYDVRLRRRPRQRQPVAEVEVVDFIDTYADLRPMARAQLRKVIPFYDPGNSNYVIIAPWSFYKTDYSRQKADKMWEPLKVKLPYFLDMRNHGVAAMRFTFIIIGIAAGAYGVGSIIAAAPVVATGTTAAEMEAMVLAVNTAAAKTAATGTAVVGYEVGAAAAVQSSIVAPAAITAKLAAGSTAMVAYHALLTAPAVKAAAAVTGALLVLGNVKTAAAEGLPPAVDNVVTLRVVPVADFQDRGGVLSASSSFDENVYLTPEEAKGKFNLGTKVLYDNKPHFVMGQVMVR